MSLKYFDPPTATDIVMAGELSQRMYDQIFENILRTEKLSNYRPPMYLPEKYSKYDLMPKQIIHNAEAVIVFWKDGSKTIVRRREGDPDDIHSAFAQALVKKLFGATTTAHKMVDRVTKEQELKKKG